MDKKLEKDLFKFTEEILKGYKHIEAFIKKTDFWKRTNNEIFTLHTNV